MALAEATTFFAFSSAPRVWRMADVVVAGAFPAGGEAHPFLRYRALLSPYRLLRAAALPEAARAAAEASQ